jgi:hypothetical protein
VLTVLQGNIDSNAGPDVRVADANDGAAFEEETKRSLAGEGSVGSDTDNSKADAAGTASKDGEGRESSSRNNIKKSASFKPVSVTKNFLAKAGSAAAPTKSVGGSEKASSTPGGSPALSAQSTPRPRLVAKSISGQKGALPRASSASGRSGQNGGPDPSQVWNKNRVQVATATPKHLTDEELRQQYGIQLASRPIEDGDSNQAKWADIDDEDDDWAPETIEWNDGTKINLAETAANTATENNSASKEKPGQEQEPERKEVPAPQAKTSSIGPNATVLKLGSASQQKPPTASSKLSSEKPTLVAKPAVPTQVKSPWAALPPVEKVSPIQINAPMQNSAPRFNEIDPHGFDSMPPPAKEIEADDFSRFRDHPNGNQRELYVPHSGRYEPVNDSRRGPPRRDGNFRQPSVLQRPSPGDRDQAGPAEPSAAFQTNRSQQDGPPWGRRRGSSSGSVDNGRFGRRMSFGRSQDSRAIIDGPGRRGSQFEPRDASPSHSHGLSVASQSPVTSNAAGPNSAPGAGQMEDSQNQVGLPEQSMEDAVAMQKRLMREKREAAIKRREEEEARQEAEKRERIRQRLERLGLPTDNKPAGKKPTESETKPKDSAETAPLAPKSAPKENKEARPVLATSPPKPPIPSPSGEPQQYGLMKVHAPQPAPLTSPRGSHAAARQSPSSSSIQDPKSIARTDAKPQLPNGDAAARAADMLSSRPDTGPKDHSPEARSWSGMQPQQSGQFSDWGTSTMATHSPQGGNLWGPPSNHRALGNGDFQSNIQRASLKPTPAYSSQSPVNPQPIGTGRHFTQPPQNHHAASSNKSELLAGTIIEDLQTIPAYPSESDPLTRGPQPRPEVSAGARSPASHQHIQAAPPAAVTSAHQPQSLEPSNSGVAAWSHFSQNSGRQETEQATQEHAARMAEQQLGLTRPPTLPTLNETWKQVKRGDGQGTRQIIGTTHMTNNYAPSTQNQGVEFHKTIAPSVGPAPRSSRYQDIFDHHHRSATSTPPGPRPASPIYAPPPETNEHPAYGIDRRPLVNLPGNLKSSERTREPMVDTRDPTTPVTVKLPPPNEVPASAPRTTGRQMSYSKVVKNASATMNWQTRFDSLLNRETKVPSPPVLSATKPHFEVAPAGTTAVSLPVAAAEGGNNNPVLSSAEEEEALFEEERAFGSTPTIRVPQKASVEMWSMAPLPDYKKFPPRSLRDDQVMTVRHDLLVPGEDLRHPNSAITIYLLGMPKAQSKPFSRKYQGSHRVSKPNNRSKPRPGGKGRDASHGQPRVASTEMPAGASTGTAPPKAKAGFGGRHASYNRRTSGVAT